MAQEPYRIILKKDADFWQDELTFTDSDDDLITLLDAELTIHPSNDSDDEVWNVGNGKLSMPSTGVIRFEVLLEEIAAYEWADGEYCLAVTYSNGMRDRSILRGPVEITEEC
jgi:hypothetical protein